MLALSLVAGMLLAPAALAHNSPDQDVLPVIDRITPEMEGVTISIETTPLGSQFVVENPTETEVTILSSVGDPLYRIGPEGVLGNFRSPEWYTGKVPDGAITIPERAAERGTPVWARVNTDPAWGWFDHRLHAVGVEPERKAELAPLAELGTWSVPVQFGGQLGAIEGHYEFRPPVGQFVASISETEPAPGVTLLALQGNPTPGLSIDNNGSSEVIVLGDEGEPYLRITPAGTEANALSRTWVTSQDPSAVAGRGLDPAAPPQWVPANAGSQYSIVLRRAEPEQDLAELYAIESPTVVREWTVSMIIDGRPVEIQGETTMTPVGYEPSVWWTVLYVVGAVLVAGAVMTGLWWFVARRRSRPGPTSARPTGKKQKVGSAS
ncbi:MAG TPA: hypothetical protein VM367_07555 [Pseudonocardia sp.]|nr:hypothetical protein [Pseudonocardia sp.]